MKEKVGNGANQQVKQILIGTQKKYLVGWLKDVPIFVAL